MTALPRALMRLLAAALLAAPLASFAQQYPNGPVHVVVPFPAGSGVDHDIVGSTPAEFAAVIVNDLKVWGDLATKLGARVD